MSDLGTKIGKRQQVAELFSFRGRIGRAAYLRWWIAISVAGIFLLEVALLILAGLSDAVRNQSIGAPIATAFSWLIALSFLIGFYWPSVALQVRRFHDCGRSGWWWLVGIIPYVGALAVGVYTVFCPGNAAENRFGAVPANRLGAGTTAGLLIGGLILIGVMSFGARAFLIEPFNIPSASNVPTLLPGDFVAVSKFDARSSQRGDLVVFTNPLTGEDYIKRIVGLPGDRVQMRGGVLVVNDTPWPRERIADYEDKDWDSQWGREFSTKRFRYIETMPNGLKHEILGNPTSQAQDSLPQDNTGPVQVPDGRFFAIGDSRDNSNDSRMQLGSIPLDKLRGHAQFILFSSQDRKSPFGFWGGSLQARWSRVLTVLN